MRKLQEVAGIDNITTVVEGARIKSVCREKYLLLFRYTDLKNNLRILNSKLYQNKCVLLFCAPAETAQIYKPQFLDQNQNGKPSDINLEIVKLPSQKIRLAKCTALALHVKKFLTDSVLHKLMTFLYTIPSTRRVEIQTALQAWLFSGKPALEDLRELCIKLELRKKQVALVNAIFEAQTGVHLRYAACVVSKYKRSLDADELSKIASQHKTDAYELSYLYRKHNNMQSTKNVATVYAGKQKFGDARLRET
jgi:hypothetical protein